MDLVVLQAFTEELEKLALSPAFMTRYLAARASQGVGGAQALGKGLQKATAAGATTSREVMAHAGGLGKAQLEATVSGGAAATRAQKAFPQKALLQSRIQGAESMAGKYDYSKPLANHDAFTPVGGAYGYSPAHIQAVTRSPGQISDPRALMTQTTRAPAINQPTPPMGASHQVSPLGSTAVSPLAAAPTQIAKRPVTQATVASPRRRPQQVSV